MDEESTNSAGPGTYVFVRAPDGCINVPGVELEGYVANRVGEIPEDEYSEGTCMSCDERDIKKLASVELDPWKQYECCILGMFVYG